MIVEWFSIYMLLSPVTVFVSAKYSHYSSAKEYTHNAMEILSSTKNV